MAVGPKIAIAKILTDWWQFSKGSPYVYMRIRNMADFNLAVAKAKFNSPPVFSAIQ